MAYKTLAKVIGVAATLVGATACDDALFLPHSPTIEGEGWCGVRSLFATECISCHSSAAALGGLDLQTDPHAAIVGVTSTAYGAVLVEAGNADNSLLLRKLEGTQAEGEGDAMPPTGLLDAALVDVVRKWIAEGADDVCATTTNPTGGYHPQGWAAPDAHGMGAKFQTDACQDCHGLDFPADGGVTAISCGSCHDTVVPDWTTTCTFCHGDPAEGSGAPPQDIDDNTNPNTISFPAHLGHVQASDLHVAWDCSVCHVKPDDVFSAGHVFNADSTAGRAEVFFAVGTIGAGGTYTESTQTCGVYCHSDGQGTLKPTAVGATVVCGGCHGVNTGWRSMSGAHQKHLQNDDGGPIDCVDCHNTATAAREIDPVNKGQHMDGIVELALPVGVTWEGAACSGACHGHLHADERWLKAPL